MGGSVTISVGFTAGCALMLSLEAFMDDDHDEDDKKKELVPKSGEAQRRSFGRRSTTMKRSMTSLYLSKELTTPVPWSSAVPILVDSWMDGLLIGVVLMV